MTPVAIILGAIYFGYFKMMEILTIRESKLFNYVFQKSDLVEDFDHY